MSSPLDLLARRVSDLERRVNSIVFGTGMGSAQYGPNGITNGDIEAGLTGWGTGFFAGTVGTLAVDTTAPIDGLRSLKMTEAANSATWCIWVPNPGSPNVGVDVFSTTGGDVWLITGLMQSSVATTHSQLYALCGVAPSDCYGLNGGNTSWQLAVDLPLTANTPTQMQGTVTIPNGFNYVGFGCMPSGVGITPPTSAWNWWLDLVSLQQRAN